MTGPSNHQIIGLSKTNSVLLRWIDGPMNRFPTSDHRKSATGWNLPSSARATGVRPSDAASEFCPADLVDWMGSGSRRWATGARTRLHPTVTLGYYINPHHESQGKCTRFRGYRISLPENNCIGDLFCKPTAFPSLSSASAHRPHPMIFRH
jgi:hypothetical protein